MNVFRFFHLCASPGLGKRKFSDNVLNLIHSNSTSPDVMTTVNDLLCWTDVPVQIATDGMNNMSTFNFDLYFSLLRTKSCGHVVLHSRVMSSTQTICGLFSRVPFLTVLTDKQTKGRGRKTNSWVSPEGCLLVSFSYLHRNPATLVHFQYLVGLALVHSIQRLVGQDIGLKLKWPNDLYVGEKSKIGGVLCESVSYGDQYLVTIGIGLNVTNSEPTTCLKTVTSEYFKNSHSKSQFDCSILSRENILAFFFNSFQQLHSKLDFGGFEAIKEDYLAKWLHRFIPDQFS
eukprot:TRINITY_DN4574_c0_g1_i9.p1 TRINITY_DN4574_c0_g1~~TRINITY_DN4574_c0_g1_i9.p1  ORF type:complete len:287 (-),score=31.29 TRINITY_DN4574_c0_g1_i9:1035-1895(-)